MPGMGGPPIMRKSGGRVPGGLATKSNLSGWASYASKNSHYARGGKVGKLPTAGADSGVGRLQLSKMAARKK